MKKFIALLTLFVIALATVACGDEDTQDNTDAVLTPAQMQHDPMSFTGQLSIEGVVGEQRANQFNFSLYCDDCDFVLDIDYRGNQALPEIGTIVVITGQMNYRSCCGQHLVSTNFEVVE